jgi:type VI secretion system protein VasD
MVENASRLCPTRRWRGVVSSVIAYAASVALLGLISACGSDDKPPPAPKPEAEPVVMAPTGAKAEVTLVATPVVNPDPTGRPSPIAFTLYQLSSPAPFKDLDAFALFDNDKQSLGPTLLSTFDAILDPGGARAITTELNPKATYFGVVATYRDYQNAKWRAMLPILARDTKLRVTFKSAGVEMEREQR